MHRVIEVRQEDDVTTFYLDSKWKLVVEPNEGIIPNEATDWIKQNLGDEVIWSVELALNKKFETLPQLGVDFINTILED